MCSKRYFYVWSILSFFISLDFVIDLHSIFVYAIPVPVDETKQRKPIEEVPEVPRKAPPAKAPPTFPKPPPQIRSERVDETQAKVPKLQRPSEFFTPPKEPVFEPIKPQKKPPFSEPLKPYEAPPGEQAPQEIREISMEIDEQSKLPPFEKRLAIFAQQSHYSQETPQQQPVTKAPQRQSAVKTRPKFTQVSDLLLPLERRGGEACIKLQM